MGSTYTVIVLSILGYVKKKKTKSQLNVEFAKVMNTIKNKLDRHVLYLRVKQ